MSRISYEQYLFEQDTREKKRVARDARHTRTHCGKGGAVRFPSDYLTAKERKAMNGKVETYRMNSPISWEEFKTWPDEHKITYIKLLRQKYNVPDKALAEMFGVGKSALCALFNKLGLTKGAGHGARKWDRDAFYIWSGKAVETDARVTKDDIEEMMRENNKPIIIEDDTQGKECEATAMPVVPMKGSMSFINNNADDALATIRTLLCNTKVNITVSWETVSEQPKQEDLKKGVVAGTYALLNEERKKKLDTKG